MTLLGFQVLIAETNLWLAAIDGVIMIVKLVQTWGAEAFGICGSDIDRAEAVHQRDLGSKVVVEGLMMRQSQTYGGRDRALPYPHLRFMLGIGGQRIDVLVDVARGGCEIVLSPVGTNDGG